MIVFRRQDISASLNEAVKQLKDYFNDSAKDIKINANTIDSIDTKVQRLIAETAEDETNPSVLLHGRNALPSKDCDAQTESLQWTGSKWECKTINILSDCTPASDEYRVEQSDGNVVCQKVAKAQSINYYWRHLGYSPKCDLGTGQNAKIYGCHYKNKLNQEILVADSKCSGKVKPNASNKVCVGDWQLSAWGACSQSCSVGGKQGTQTRTATCPAGLICPAAKPALSQTCNNQICTISWTIGSWGACSQSCSVGGKQGIQYRSVTCPAGYSCPSAKPATSQTCNNQACTTNWSVGGWSACSQSCSIGGKQGTQTRSVTCKAGYACPSAKPATSQTCNNQACTSGWTVGSWGTCSGSCGVNIGVQSRSVTCPSGYSCTSTKPATSQRCTKACSTNWSVGGWSSCNKTCGGGTQSRSVTCPAGYSCNGAKPATSQSCNTQSCEECRFDIGSDNFKGWTEVGLIGANPALGCVWKGSYSNCSGYKRGRFVERIRVPIPPTQLEYNYYELCKK